MPPQTVALGMRPTACAASMALRRAITDGSVEKSKQIAISLENVEFLIVMRGVEASKKVHY